MEKLLNRSDPEATPNIPQLPLPDHHPHRRPRQHLGNGLRPRERQVQPVQAIPRLHHRKDVGVRPRPSCNSIPWTAPTTKRQSWRREFSSCWEKSGVSSSLLLGEIRCRGEIRCQFIIVARKKVNRGKSRVSSSLLLEKMGESGVSSSLLLEKMNLYWITPREKTN